MKERIERRITEIETKQNKKNSKIKCINPDRCIEVKCLFGQKKKKKNLPGTAVSLSRFAVLQSSRDWLSKNFQIFTLIFMNNHIL